MNMLQSALYGAFSGLSEFLPVSSLANQAVLMKLFGVVQRDHLCDMIVHICVLLSLYTGAGNLFEQLRYQARRKGHYRTASDGVIADQRLRKNAKVCMLALMIVMLILFKKQLNYLAISAILLINGALLFAPSRMYQGNKDARSMSVIDSFLIGASSALSAIPGFSGVGCSTSVALMRGAERHRAFSWAISLCIPALTLSILADLVLLVSNWDQISFGTFFGYIISGLFAYAGGYFSIVIAKMLSRRGGICGFAFYSWGSALLMLILFLI